MESDICPPFSVSYFPLQMIRRLLLSRLTPRPFALCLADDMGWNALSCYGNKDLQTPHLDRDAAQGSPTRAAF
jgi:hypothetical protein